MNNNISQEFETLDIQALRALGGPATYTKQIGYGLSYLAATVLVFGDNYDQVKVTFTNSAGQLSPTSGIFLSPQNTTATNQILTAGLMTLTIASISLEPPTPDTKGSVSLSATWTDLNGTGKSAFNGAIASWTNPPS
ncbi:hypothetical protein [Edaphocola aurantiacus]|uniref:hypothetical protein n=1 Tax=Edaphocola aurantiacus TaxID=2601682 RepID=UPI001C96012F|nr:hypothetical protein [Edaphocola aurantiacus]